MHRVEPKVFLIGETRVVDDGLQAYLDHLGIPDWISDAPTDVEKIPEIMGRVCYRSFIAGMNKNVTKVREHNKAYLENIVNVGHGSVLEHSQVNFIFSDVSRVFTHELVRHRVGVGISQESLRFVRLDDLGLWLPTVITENSEAVEIFVNTYEQLEQLQLQLAKLYKLDDAGTPFDVKKIVTSAMRRIAPEGLATTIGWSANIRTLRWLLELRTAPSAEEEIRLVFGKVAAILIERYAHLFGDFQAVEANGLPHYVPAGEMKYSAGHKV